MAKSSRFGRCSAALPLPELQFLRFPGKRPKQLPAGQVESLTNPATQATQPKALSRTSCTPVGRAQRKELG